MAYEKQTWISYDDNKTEEQNIKDGAVVTAERINHLEDGLDEHDKDTTNPHKVTKAQVGLGNVTNVEQAPKTDLTSHTSNKTNPHGVTKSQVGLGNVSNVEQASKTEFNSHVADKTNPHSVTKAQVNLGNVDNYATANQTDAETGIATNKFMTPARVFEAIAKWVQGKLISATENQTVTGLINFQNGIEINGVPQGGTLQQLSPLAGNSPSDRPFRVYREGKICVLEVYIKGLTGRNIAFAKLPIGYRPIENKNFDMKSSGGKMAYAWFDSSTSELIMGRAFFGGTESDIEASDYFEVAISYYTNDSYPKI